MKRTIRPGHGVVLAVVSLTLILAQDGLAVSFTPIGTLAGNAPFSLARALSADGTTVVGQGGNLRAFKWTALDGISALPRLPGAIISDASGISADGSVITGVVTASIPGGEVGGSVRWAGNSVQWVPDVNGDPLAFGAFDVSGDGLTLVGFDTSSGLFNEAATWSEQNGLTTFGLANTLALAVSGDGQIVAGTFKDSSSSSFRAFQWTPQDGLTWLNGPPFSIVPASEAFGISSDGNVIVGRAQLGNGLEAFRWKNGVMSGLGDFPGGTFFSHAGDASGDGSVIVGYGSDTNGSAAFVWDEVNQMRNIREILIANGIDMTGWQLRQAVAVSDDGTIIAGHGTNPAGLTESWVVDLSTVPEPAAGVLLVICAVGTLGRRARCR